MICWAWEKSRPSATASTIDEKAINVTDNAGEVAVIEHRAAFRAGVPNFRLADQPSATVPDAVQAANELIFSTCGSLYNHVTAARTLVKRVVRESSPTLRSSCRGN